jgi:hydroxyacylglutathione hydrolase
MKINQIYTFSHLRNFSYIIEAEDNIYCIDPYDSKQIMAFLGDKKLQIIINTHEHGDHTRGNLDLVKRYNCEIWAHFDAKGKIESVDRFLQRGENIQLGKGWEMEVLDTPGHTFAHLCLLIKENKTPYAIITGDTLFNAGVGNCYNGGDPKILYKTISKEFKNLPDNVILYPGHEYMERNLGFSLDREPSNSDSADLLKKVTGLKMEKDFFATNLSLERKINPFLRLDNLEIRKKLKIEKNNELEVFLTLRELRDKW